MNILLVYVNFSPCNKYEIRSDCTLEALAKWGQQLQSIDSHHLIYIYWYKTFCIVDLKNLQNTSTYIILFESIDYALLFPHYNEDIMISVSREVKSLAQVHTVNTFMYIFICSKQILPWYLRRVEPNSPWIDKIYFGHSMHIYLYYWVLNKGKTQSIFINIIFYKLSRWEFLETWAH